MNKKHRNTINTAAWGILFIIMAVYLPDAEPVGALPAVQVTGRSCNSCHEGVTCNTWQKNI